MKKIIVLLLFFITSITFTGCAQVTESILPERPFILELNDIYQRATDTELGCMVEFGGSIKNNTRKPVRVDKIVMDILDTDEKKIGNMSINVYPSTLNPYQEVYISSTEFIQNFSAVSFKKIMLKDTEAELVEKNGPDYIKIEVPTLKLTSYDLNIEPKLATSSDVLATLNNPTNKIINATFYSLILRNDKDEIILINNQMDHYTILPEDSYDLHIVVLNNPDVDIHALFSSGSVYLDIFCQVIE